MKHPSISYLTQEKDEQLLLSRILDKQAFCQKRNIPAYTPFLSPRMQMLARQLLAPAANLCFFGGIEEAERQMLFFLPDYETGIIDPNNSDCPICALQTSFPPQTPVTHRDILGALMGMGISREKLGDILMTPTHCTLLLQKELQRFLQEQMTQAGRARLHWQPFPLGEVERPPQKVEAIAGTVSSLRLDAVCALGFWHQPNPHRRADCRWKRICQLPTLLQTGTIHSAGRRHLSAGKRKVSRGRNRRKIP